MQALSTAWTMYANDNQGLVVSNPDNSDAGMVPQKPSWGGGWMDFTYPDSTNTALLQGTYNSYGGRLGTYLPDVRVFKCPEDTSTVTLSGKAYARSRSVSMNSYLGGMQSFNGNKLNFWVNSTFQVFVRKSDFGAISPAQIYQYIDERPDSINDGNFALDMRTVMDQFGNFIPSGYTLSDFPGVYHENGASLSFVDGHAEIWRWKDPRTTPIVVSQTAVPLDLDVEKLGASTTRPK
jgi:prepilin-type processing-associated H-X9-DG protein